MSFQSYSGRARDAKRVSDVRQLLTKIEIEHAIWVPYSELISTGITYIWQVLWTNTTIYQWTANFETLKEDRENFLDPLTKKDYIFAYTNPVKVELWDWRTEAIEFIQWWTEMEDGNKSVIWNHYTSEPEDLPWLIKWDSCTEANEKDCIWVNGDEKWWTTPTNPNPPTNNNCTLNWQTINHWNSITTYQTETVPYWNNCEDIQETRTCTNWNLSWSYEFTSCTPIIPWNCTATNLNWYDLPITNHNTQVPSTKETTDWDLIITYTQNYTCSNWNFELTWNEEQSANCINNKVLQWEQWNWSCVEDVCWWIIPEHWKSNATTQWLWTNWSYNTTPW
jgi:hypothetical protein